MQVTGKHKVFTDDLERLVWRRGPGDYPYVDREQMNQGAQMQTDQALLDQLFGLGAIPAEIDAVADLSAIVQELTADGVVALTTKFLELNHIGTPIDATLAAPRANSFMYIKNTSASGTEAHTVTLASGTWNGTNLIATLDLPGDCIVVFFDSALNGTVVENVGAVAFTGTP